MSTLDLSNTAKRNLALEKINRKVSLKRKPTVNENNYQEWLQTVFPQLELKSFSEAHKKSWEWGVDIERGTRPEPIMIILPRGGGKSTTAELLTIYLGATEKRKYVWYISGTQDLADQHLESIAGFIETKKFELYYPRMAERRLNKFGSSKGWRRNRLSCGNGFTVDARGLDVGARGLKVEENRPDLIILDDIDGLFDSDQLVQKKIDTITNNILPAGSTDLAIFCLQNLIRNDGFFGRVVNGENDYLLNATLYGPYKAVEGLVVDEDYNIIEGTATWDGQPIETCQRQIYEWSYTSFLREAQHEVINDFSLFAHINVRRIKEEEFERHFLSRVMRTVVVVDPAVTSTDNSDAHGISVVSLTDDGYYFPRYSFEQVLSPKESIKRAILLAIEFGSQEVFIETNQGGEMWEFIFNNVCGELVVNGEAKYSKLPSYDTLRASRSTGGKIERATALLAEYESGRVIHVMDEPYQTYKVLEEAMDRFPQYAPDDLIDAYVYACQILREGNIRLLL